MRKDRKPESTPPRPPAPPSLSVRCGPWFEAAATGWGVLLVPVVLALLLSAAAVGVLSLSP